MAEATSEPDKRQERHRFLALQEPRITVLTDQPLATREAYRESFALDFRMGPVLDIVRHPATRTPLAVAVYGTWGAGKTTAMKWLHALIDIWNDKKKKSKDKGAIRVTPVWFYPWKYQSKEDVWRGLVAEVIIQSLSINDVTVPKVVNAAKRFGLFLGRSFVHVLASLAQVISFGWLSSASKTYLLKTDGVVRPFIFQDRDPVEFNALREDSDEGSKREKFLYGVRARFAMSYGLWQFAVRSGFTT